MTGTGGDPVSRRVPDVCRVTASAAAPLRAAVLRPGLGVAAVSEADDDAPHTLFLAVLGPGGRVLSTVNVRPRRPPWDPDEAGWWQLRGMATAESARRRGHAGRLLLAALEHVDDAHGQVWCNARTGALELYARSGFGPVGEPWTHPERGPHQTMARPAQL